MHRNPIPSPALNLCRQVRLLMPQRLHTRPQPQHIQRTDRKRSVTALRTPQPADQPLPRPPRHIGQRRIHNLHQFSISRWQLDAAKDIRSDRDDHRDAQTHRSPRAI